MHGLVGEQRGGGVLAERVVKSGNTFDARLDGVTTRLLTRKFTDAERAVAKGAYDDLLAYYKANPADAKQLVESQSGANTASWLSLAHALRGDLGAASSWRDESIRRRKKANARPAATLLLDAILACRRGDEVAAAELIAAEWREVEQTHTAVELRPVQAVHAFALSRTGADRVVVTRHLAAARAGGIGELDYLGAEWTEMATFGVPPVICPVGSITLGATPAGSRVFCGTKITCPLTE